jgi:hypothetical protein
MNINGFSRLAMPMAAACTLMVMSSITLAQNPSRQSKAVAPGHASSMAPQAVVKLAEGTEVHVHLGEALSSATSAEGDTFQVVLDEPIALPDGTIIPAGYSGKGEVTKVEKAGMLGKSGQLSIRVNYLKIGDIRIRLRANKASEGKSGVTNMVVTTVLLGPIGLIVRGHSIVYPKGQLVTAYVDEDTDIMLPIAPPPEAG